MKTLGIIFMIIGCINILVGLISLSESFENGINHIFYGGFVWGIIGLLMYIKKSKDK